MELLVESLIALVALTLMEIVLGIDNIIFIAILTDRLPEEQQPKARKIGLGVAMLMRIALLMTLSAIMHLTNPLFYLTELGIPEKLLDADHLAEVNAVSWRDLILFGGGLFLLGKSVKEIHEQFHGEDELEVSKQTTMAGVLFQIVLLDIIFSLDSVITAVGMVDPGEETGNSGIWIMVTAIILAVGVMLVFAGRVSEFVKRNPTVKMLALSFLIMIGVMLVAEGAGTHINKGYIYFAMAFSLIVELLNIGLRKRRVLAKASSTEAS